MTFYPSIKISRKVWYLPSLNLGLRATSAIILFLALGILFNHVSITIVALTTLPSALISGLDSAGPRRWSRFAVTSATWTITLVITYALLTSGVPLWLTYGTLAFVLASSAVNGPFWGRLGMSSILIAIMCLSLYHSHAPIHLYPLLVLGPLIFALFSWMWFEVWKHYALRVSLSAIFETLVKYVMQQQAFLLGELNDKSRLQTKHRLIELFQQALQSESFLGKRKDAQSLKQALFLALDIFELLLCSHTSNPALLTQIQNAPLKQALLQSWSQQCQQILSNKSTYLLFNQQYEKTELGGLEQRAKDLIESVRLKDQPRFQYWENAMMRLSQRIDRNEPVYERPLDVQPFELSLRWPTKNSPVWGSSARIGVMFAVGVGISHYFALIKPTWVLISMLMVIQPSFLATRSKIWQRCLGTAFGVLIASVLLQLGLPASVILALVAILLPLAMLNLMHNYSVAIGCITLLVILVSPLLAHQGINYSEPRLIDNLIGAAIVMLGHIMLWPRWRGKEIHSHALAALGASKDLFLYCNQQFQIAPEHRDTLSLLKRRAAMLSAEHALELIYSEMQQEPLHTRADPQFYEDMLSDYRLLNHYICLLLPLVRTDVYSTISEQTDEFIGNTLDALINSIRDSRLHELPMLSTNLKGSYQPSNTDLRARAIEEIQWLALMTVKQMHDSVRKRISTT
ncbi:FUSC family protein [Vibrio marisflavi]|uniref:Inner membrane protein YccS n=1 Tax=Vibrio marisflavi CECT 7928 TaxID=634439 RepID=A0ABN8DZV8_9VIBR|nr:FUSC family protein [Vibrio marisflavi]CAH0537393.1 hypothetical protein VMF7928_01087 [Vibrio marisflavi CECT 7928]